MKFSFDAHNARARKKRLRPEHKGKEGADGMVVDTAKGHYVDVDVAYWLLGELRREMLTAMRETAKTIDREPGNHRAYSVAEDLESVLSDAGLQ